MPAMSGSGLSVELTSGFRAVHDPVSDTAERERRYVFEESLAFQYRYGDKTFLQSRLSYDRSDPASSRPATSSIRGKIPPTTRSPAR